MDKLELHRAMNKINQANANDPSNIRPNADVKGKFTAKGNSKFVIPRLDRVTPNTYGAPNQPSSSSVRISQATTPTTPERNLFQQAQDFLRDKLNGKTKVTGSRITPSTQQTTTDAKSGGKALRAYEQTRSSKPKINSNVKKGAGLLTGLFGSAGGIATTLATTLTSGEDQTTKWKRLGYPSKEHYAAVVAGTMTPQQVKDGKPVPGITGKFADLRGSDKPGSSTPAKTNAGEGEAMDAADKFRPGAGYPAGVVRPTDYKTKPGQLHPDLDPSSNGSGRTNSEGLVQYGQTLGGLNTFNKGFLGEGYDIADVRETYQSEALPATLAGVTQLSKPIAGEMEFDKDLDVSYSDKPPIAYDGKLPDSTKPFASVDSYTPYSTGSNPKDPQDGASPKPDRVERLRQVAFNGADFSGDEPDDSTLVSPMYANKERNKIRRTFLDYEGSSVKAAVAANAQAGFGKDSNGNARFNVGGELVNAKEGMEWKAKDAAMRGVDPSEFLQMKVAEVKETSKVTPTIEETPTPSTSAVVTPGLTPDQENTEYGAMKFVRDPKTNSMVPAK